MDGGDATDVFAGDVNAVTIICEERTHLHSHFAL